jgi:uncharacterized protein
MRIIYWFMALLLVAQPLAWAYKGAPEKELSRGAGPMDAPLPPYLAKPLPELKGVVSWRTLAQVEAVQIKDRFVPQFSSNVTALDKKEVKLQGFMMPLDMGDRQKRFLLAAMPPTCAFCLPGGPDQIVEVQARVPVRYGFEPIIVSGRFVVLKDDPMGLFYRLTDAVAVSR